MDQEIILFPLTSEERHLAEQLEYHLQGAAPYGLELSNDLLGLTLPTVILGGTLFAVLYRWAPGFPELCRSHGGEVVLTSVGLIGLIWLVIFLRNWLGYYRPRRRQSLAELRALLADPLVPCLRRKYKKMAAARAILADQSPTARALLNPTQVEDRARARLLASVITK